MTKYPTNYKMTNDEIPNDENRTFRADSLIRISDFDIHSSFVIGYFVITRVIRHFVIRYLSLHFRQSAEVVFDKLPIAFRPFFTQTL